MLPESNSTIPVKEGSEAPIPSEGLMSMDDAMRDYFALIYRYTRGNLAKTARILKISRSSAFRYRDKWGIR